MTRDEIIRMAREAGDEASDFRGRLIFEFDTYGIEKFAALVAAAERRRTWLPADWTEYERGIAENEREACAQLCEKADDDEFYFGRNYAEAIRARGNT